MGRLMSYAVVPIEMLNDPNVNRTDILLYLTVSASTPNGVLIAGLADKVRCDADDVIDSLVRMLAAGVLDAVGGRLILGPIGGDGDEQ